MIIQASTNLVTLHGRAIVEKIRKTLIKDILPREGAAAIYFNFHFKSLWILFCIQIVTIEFSPPNYGRWKTSLWMKNFAIKPSAILNNRPNYFYAWNFFLSTLISFLIFFFPLLQEFSEIRM